MRTEVTPVVVEELGKDYREGFLRRRKTALESATFRILAGSTYGLLGPNGAGKSTTLHLLLGFLRPSRGKVFLFGRLPSDEASRSLVGFLPEVFVFDRFSTGRTLLARFDRLSGRAAEGRARRIDAALAAVGLQDAAARRVGTYSKGMTQRIGVAQAILGEPDLLILDEPMSGMDPATRHSVKELLRERRERGKTTLFSTHILSDVEAVADRLLILHHGRTLFEGPIALLQAVRPGSRVVFSMSAPERLQGVLAELELSCVASPDGAETFVVDVADGDRVNRLLGHLTQEGARVIAVIPLRASLESLFLEMTRDADESAVRGQGP